jgi:hypothetical protein
LILAPYRSG